MKRFFLFFILTPMFLFSQEITIDWLETKPKGLYRNFYIYQYLKQDITPEQAYEVLPYIKNMSLTMFYEFAKKYNNEDTLATVQCMKADIKDLIDKDADCFAAGFSVYKASLLDTIEADTAKSTLMEKYPDLVDVIDIIKAPMPFTRLVSTSDDLFFKIFNEVGTKFRDNYFNYMFPPSLLERISQDKKFENSIKLIVLDSKLDNLKKSILDLNSTITDSYSHQTNFLLALNAISQNDTQKAKTLLDSAFEKAYLKSDKDKVLFWKYLVSDDNNSLEEVSNSWDNNIYSLYAKELTNKKPENIVYDLNVSNERSDYNETDPFNWLETQEEIKSVDDTNIQDLINKYSFKNTQGHLAYILQKYNNYKISYYITPYKEFLDENDIPLERQVLIYSLAMQESRFIPATLSSSFAMGMMQIMPFLSKELAGELHEDYNIYDQFDPHVNLIYANKYLDYLTSKLNHPLFVAYAYNGGIGNFLRNIQPSFYKKDSKYEPFMSMELINFDETKEYGKKVLANYYIYKNYFDQNSTEDNSLSSIFQKLK